MRNDDFISGDNDVTNVKALRKQAMPVLVLAGFLAPAIGHAAAATGPTACAATLSSLNGWYGLLVSGATAGSTPTPKYLTGALLFNGAGAISGNNIYSGAGIDSAATGSYAVNTDCTVSINLSIGGVAQAYTVAITQSNEAVGLETDSTAVARIDLQAQYSTVTTGLNFTNSSLNGTFAASCAGPIGAYSDLNVVSFSNGTLAGTDPYNNGGSVAVANNPYTGTYKVNTDGTFVGSISVDGTPFVVNGVISNSGTKIEYVYSGVTNGQTTAAFASCTGKLSPPITYNNIT